MGGVGARGLFCRVRRGEGLAGPLGTSPPVLCPAPRCWALSSCACGHLPGCLSEPRKRWWPGGGLVELRPASHAGCRSAQPRRPRSLGAASGSWRSDPGAQPGRCARALAAARAGESLGVQANGLEGERGRLGPPGPARERPLHPRRRRRRQLRRGEGSAAREGAPRTKWRIKRVRDGGARPVPVRAGGSGVGGFLLPGQGEVGASPGSGSLGAGGGAGRSRCRGAERPAARAEGSAWPGGAAAGSRSERASA